MITFAIAISILILGISSTFAQQQSTPIEQAMGQKIMVEINAGLACSARVIEVQKQLDEANAKLKELQSKDKPQG